MSGTADWREVLGHIISNPAERDRIANEIGVHPITLARWVSGDSSPRSHNLRQLVRALPKQQRLQLLALLDHTTTDVSDYEFDRSSQEIAYQFVMEVLETRATTPAPLRFWSITRLVLQQARAVGALPVGDSLRSTSSPVPLVERTAMSATSIAPRAG